MMVQEVLDAVVIQSDGVEHARSSLDGARRRVAGARMARDRLGNDAAEPSEVHDAGHFPRIAKRARGDEDWVLQLQAAEGDGEIDHYKINFSPARTFRTFSTSSSPPPL